MQTISKISLIDYFMLIFSILNMLVRFSSQLITKFIIYIISEFKLALVDR